ncbi:hypothetical protein DFH27DRAFT_560110, partial [Peziza echinospora]
MFFTLGLVDFFLLFFPLFFLFFSFSCVPSLACLLAGLEGPMDIWEGNRWIIYSEDRGLPRPCIGEPIVGSGAGAGTVGGIYQFLS